MKVDSNLGSLVLVVSMMCMATGQPFWAVWLILAALLIYAMEGGIPRVVSVNLSK